MQDRTPYSAAASLCGYLYQCRLALLETLKRLKSDPDIVVAIETLDDVVFEKNGKPSEIIQVKHHVAQRANLSNASTDLWKTIRIWCDLLSQGLLEDNSLLFLMTTAVSAEDSAAYYLRNDGRDIVKAEEQLWRISQTSSNQTNQEGYQKFNSLTPVQRKELLERVYILDNCPSSQDCQALLEKELWGVCERQRVRTLLEYLEGWWFQRILALIDGGALASSASREKYLDTDLLETPKITGWELESHLNSLREQFKVNSLPINPEIQSAEPEISQFVDMVFAKQIRLLNLPENRIQRAAKNFYRAVEQRSQWVRASLLVDDSLEQYDKRLIEEWEIQFDQATESLSVDSTSDNQIKSGRKVFNWVESEADIPIRPSCQEIFITRGTYQILANRLRVGWHPDFRAIFATQSLEDDL